MVTLLLYYSDITKLEQRNRNVKKEKNNNYIYLKIKKVNLFQYQYNLKWVFTTKQINQSSDACQAHFITIRRSEWVPLFYFNLEDHTK